MAHIEKRGEYSWRLVVPMGYDAKGKRRRPAQKTIRVEDPKLLRAPKRLETYLSDQLSLFKAQVESGELKKDAKMTFTDFCKFWFENHVASLEYKTRTNYEFHYDTRIKPYFESYYLDEITTAHIVKFMTALRDPDTKVGKRRDGKPGPLGSATLVYVYRVLLSIFSKANQWKKLQFNPMEGVDKPEENDIKKVEVYNEGEIEQLFEALEREIHELPQYAFERTMFQVLISLDLTTGMRRAELLGLKRSSFKFHFDTKEKVWRGSCEVLDTIPAFKDGEPVIKRPKNNEPRVFALSSSIVMMLMDYFEQLEKKLRFLTNQDNVVSLNGVAGMDYYAFPNLKTGKPRTPDAIKQKWYDFHDRNPQLKFIKFHAIRHTATSIMIAKNVHAKAIANRLGWKNTKMVDHYGKIFASVDEAAAAVFEDVLPPAKRKL